MVSKFLNFKLSDAELGKMERIFEKFFKPGHLLARLWVC